MRHFLLIFLIVGPLFAAEPADKHSSLITATEQDVIEAAFDQCPETKGSHGYVLEDSTSLEIFRGDTHLAAAIHDAAKDRDASFKEALKDFIRKNTTDTKLVFPKHLPSRIRLIATKTLSEIFSAPYNKKPDGWDIFHKRFPGAVGTVTVSQPGIDSKQTIAIICVGERSGYLEGSGEVCILTFNGKRWILRNDVRGPSWES